MKEVLLVLVVAFSACTPGPDEEPESVRTTTGSDSLGDPGAAPESSGTPLPSSDVRIDAWACDGFAFAAATGENDALLYLPDSTRRIPHVPAASGAKYETEGALFWTRGDEAILQIDGRAYADCRIDRESSPWVSARVRGIRFRAIGQEPGWYVEVAVDRLSIVADYGEIEIRMPAPEIERDVDGTVRSLTAETAAHAVTISVDPTTCADPMSGFESPLTVRMTLDGRSLDGCGRELGPAFLGDWRILRLGPASPAPGTGEGAAEIELGAWGSASGTTGCNRMSGEWTSGRAGEIRLGPLATTRRACAPDLMAQEARVLESLAAVRGYRVTDDSLVLLGPDRDVMLTAVPATR